MNQHDTLATEVLQQLVGDPDDNGMPVILARRFDPQIRPDQTVNIDDPGFEGLRAVHRNGKLTWEPDHDFKLIIDGRTGHCRIPDTPRNRKRLERLEKPTTDTVKRIVLGENGKTHETEETVTTPPTYQRIERNLAQSALVDHVAQRVLELMVARNEKADEDATAPKAEKKMATKPVTPLPADLTEPLR